MGTDGALRLAPWRCPPRGLGRAWERAGARPARARAQSSCRGVVGVLLAREHVARAAHGEDAARRLRIVLDHGADARDMNVDRAVEGLERMALERIHDLVAREHPAGTLREDDEEIELVAGEVARLAVEPGDARADVDLETAEAEHVVAGR